MAVVVVVVVVTKSAFIRFNVTPSVLFVKGRLVFFLRKL